MSPVHLVRRPALLALTLAAVATLACASAPQSPSGASAGGADRPAGEGTTTPGAGTASATAPGVEASNSGGAGASASDSTDARAAGASAPVPRALRRLPDRRLRLPPRRSPPPPDPHLERRRLSARGAAGRRGAALPLHRGDPADWKVHQVPDSAGLWLGPAAASRRAGPRMVYVRISPASLADPAAVAANIRTSDAADPKWAASMVEVRDVNGVRACWCAWTAARARRRAEHPGPQAPLPKTQRRLHGLGAAFRVREAGARLRADLVLGPAPEVGPGGAPRCPSIPTSAVSPPSARASSWRRRRLRGRATSSWATTSPSGSTPWRGATSTSSGSGRGRTSRTARCCTSPISITRS